MIERTDGKKERRKMRNDDERRNMLIVVCVGIADTFSSERWLIPIEWAWILVLTLVGRFGTLEGISFCCLSYCAALLYA